MKWWISDIRWRLWSTCLLGNQGNFHYGLVNFGNKPIFKFNYCLLFCQSTVLWQQNTFWQQEESSYVTSFGFFASITSYHDITCLFPKSHPISHPHLAFSPLFSGMLVAIGHEGAMKWWISDVRWCLWSTCLLGNQGNFHYGLVNFGNKPIFEFNYCLLFCQNWLKTYFMNILRVFDDHHMCFLTSLWVNLMVSSLFFCELP